MSFNIASNMVVHSSERVSSFFSMFFKMYTLAHCVATAFWIVFYTPYSRPLVAFIHFFYTASMLLINNLWQSFLLFSAFTIQSAYIWPKNMNKAYKLRAWIDRNVFVLVSMWTNSLEFAASCSWAVALFIVWIIGFPQFMLCCVVLLCRYLLLLGLL